jgi:hypothetical protein
MLAEMTTLGRLAYAGFRLLAGPPRIDPLAGLAAVLRAGIGVREPTWYERHRDLYATTGDPAELSRMLRHVR